MEVSQFPVGLTTTQTRWDGESLQNVVEALMVKLNKSPTASSAKLQKLLWSDKHTKHLTWTHHTKVQISISGVSLLLSGGLFNVR